MERAALHAEDALHSLQSLTISPIAPPYSRFDQVGALFGLPPPIWQEDAATLVARAEYEAWEQARQPALIRKPPHRVSEETLTQEPISEIQGRFDHLELEP